MSVSIPTDLVDFVRARAEKLGEPQSGVIADAIRRLLLAERQREIIEGMLEDAEWHRELAREGMASSPQIVD